MDPWIFLAFVPFGSGVVIVSFSFFFSLNPDALSGSLRQCLSLLCLRCVQRVKLLSERFGILLQKTSDVPALRESLLTRGCARGSLRRWSETGYFPPPSLHCWVLIPSVLIPSLSVPSVGSLAGCAGAVGSIPPAAGRCRWPARLSHRCPPRRAAVRHAGTTGWRAVVDDRTAAARQLHRGHARRGGGSPLLRPPLCTLHMPESHSESEAELRAPVFLGLPHQVASFGQLCLRLLFKKI